MLPISRVVVSGAVFALFFGAAAWRPAAQRQAGRPAAAVQILDPAAAQPAMEASDWGATFYWLESQAGKVTTTFADAVAVAERDAGGDVKTRLTDLAGNELATLRLDRLSTDNDVIDFLRPGEAPIRAAGQARLRPTLDWGNRQAYSLWKDLRAAGSSRLEWRGNLMRPAGAGARNLNREIREVRTEWPGQVTATSVPEARLRRHPLTGVKKQGRFFKTRLRKGGRDLGSLRWEEEEQLLTWSFPSITEGYLDAERLAEVGGWTFAPDAAWGNVQSFAFHYFASKIASDGFVAGRGRGWAERFMNVISPAVLANEPGCDGFHWLDRTIFRYCCDVHDYCYFKHSCTWRSWWTVWTSWRCDACNIFALYCFSSGGRAPYHDSPF
jgi:hypothetical protein